MLEKGFDEVAPGFDPASGLKKIGCGGGLTTD